MRESPVAARTFFADGEKTGRRSLPLRCLLNVTAQWHSLGATIGVVNVDEEMCCFCGPFCRLPNGPLIARFEVSLLGFW